MQHFSTIITILPKKVAQDVLKNIIPNEVSSKVIINARGTIFKDKWYQSLRPVISPELTIIEMLLPHQMSESIMNGIASAANLQSNGAGMVYSIECEKVIFLKERNWDFNYNISNDIIDYKNDLKGIYCITQFNEAEKVAVAAIKAGSHGPTVTYGYGRGVREKLGLLRIAIRPEKEIIRLVTDHYNVEPVLEAMIEEGKLHTAGMGFIYVVPAEKGIVNMMSVSKAMKQLAHQYQIIKAIDELKGDSRWRTQDDYLDQQQRNFKSNQKRLTCVIERGKGNALIQAALNAGAPAATISYGIEGDHEFLSDYNVTINKEVEVIEFICSQQTIPAITDAMTEKIKEDPETEAYIYIQKVEKSFTYLG